MTDSSTAAVDPTILVADDDDDLLLLMSRRLSKAGYHVITASNGRQALDLIAEFTPRMAILDVMMPEVTGPEVLRRIRADAATTSMLVMLVSAGLSVTAAEAGPSAAADDYLAKPFLPGQLRERVEALFRRD